MLHYLPKKGWSALLIGAMLMAGGARAQFTAGTQDSADARLVRIPAPRHGFVGAPYIKYTPETGWAGGLVGLYYFHLSADTTMHSLSPGRETPAARPSSISGGGSYTQRKQYGIGLHTDLYLSEDIYHLQGGFDFKRTPFHFFGIGNNNGPEYIDSYTPLWVGAIAKLTQKFRSTSMGEGLSAGISVDLRQDNIISSDSAGILQTGTIPGAQGGMSSGFGITANFDTRDNIYATHEGTYAALDVMFYGSTTGSDFTFSRWSLDLRDFIPAFEDHTIALQGLVTLSNGDEPFYMMSTLGGEYNMRGYYQGRFRDKQMIVVQAEYRLPVWWRFGLVAFADAGEVAHTAGEFTTAGIHFTFGPGIRLMIIPKQHLDVRLDYGISSDSHELYFSVLEAF